MLSYGFVLLPDCLVTLGFNCVRWRLQDGCVMQVGLLVCCMLCIVLTVQYTPHSRNHFMHTVGT
jgi:hypothetical protein